MGRFEDLVKQAREGDEAALDALETEFSGSTLREKAESAETFQKQYQDNLPLIRKAKFQELFDQLDDELKGSGLTHEAFGEFDPNALTLDTVKEKAKSSLDAAQESRLSVAQQAGFDTVEEFDKAMETMKAQNEKRKADMESAGAGVSSSGGLPSGAGDEGDEGPTEAMFEAWEGAKKSGMSNDRAMAKGIGALIDAQLERAENE